MTRLRFRYTKLGKIRFIGHRDLARTWERALRRSGLAVASTEGFSPRPKLHFGLALSTGFESLGEYLDVDLLDASPQHGAPPQDGLSVETHGDRPDVLDDPAALTAELSALLPPGIEVQAVARTSGGLSLQEAVTACDWRIELAEVDLDAVAGRVADLLAAPTLEITRERKGKTTTADVRASLESLEVIGEVTREGWTHGVAVSTRVGTVAPALKLAELVELCAPGVADHRCLRLHQWIESEGEGARQEPLPLATPLAHAGARAS